MSYINVTVRNITELVDAIDENINFENKHEDPVTYRFLYDPVTSDDGITYNRSTVEEMQRNGTKSSFSGLIISSFVTNQSMINDINDFLLTKGIDMVSILSVLRNRTSIHINIPIEDKSPIVISNENLETNDPIRRRFIIVLDNSGSMEAPERILEKRMTRLTLVKYAAFLLVSKIPVGDDIIIVSFSSSAHVVQPLITVSEFNRDDIISRILSVRADGMTNITSGIKLGGELSIVGIPADVSCHVFTDGEDNSGLDLGRTYNRLVNRYSLNDKITFYGFSTEVKIDTILSMSRIVPFYFISDSSMLLTAFVNGFANSYSKQSTIFSQDAEYVIGGIYETLSMIFGHSSFHSRRLLLDRKIQYLTLLKKSVINAVLLNIIDNFLLDFIDNLDPALGQISKAIEDQFFSLWGRTYIGSYMNAVFNKICVNYKDNGLKCFITPERKMIIEGCEDFIENNPIDSVRGLDIRDFHGTQTSGSNFFNPTTSTVINSRQTSGYDPMGGCFTENSLIMTSNGYIRISEITSETLVKTNKGLSKVIVKTSLDYDGNVYEVGDCKFTPYHPVMLFGEDLFPISLGNPKYYSGKVYDLVLYNRGLIMISDNTFAASLNHDCEIGCFKHSYFGTDSIRSDLLSCSFNFEIILKSSDFIRDVESSNIIGLDINTIRMRNLQSYYSMKVTTTGNEMIKFLNRFIINSLPSVFIENVEKKNDDHVKILEEGGFCDNTNISSLAIGSIFNQ